MKFTIAILAALLIATGAFAQDRGGGAYYGPFTDAEAQLLSAVWPEIREAENYGDINWPAHGLARAPGSREVQRVMSANWPELRTASRFEQIDWDELVEDRAPQTQRYDSGSGRQRPRRRPVQQRGDGRHARRLAADPRGRELRGHQLASARARARTRRPNGTRNNGEQLGPVSRSRAVRRHQLGRKHCVVADARAAIGT